MGRKPSPNQTEAQKQHASRIKQWYSDHPSRTAEYRKAYKESGMLAKVNRNCHFKASYGIDLEQYNVMFQKQQGYCKICGKHQSQFKRRLAVDHDHATGKVRGLLCCRCNWAVGVYEVMKEKIEEYLL